MYQLIKVIADLRRVETFHNTQLHMAASRWGSSDSELNTTASTGIWMELFGIHCRNQAKLPSRGLGAKLNSLKAKVMGKTESGWQ